MNALCNVATGLPLHQQAIKLRCVHPVGSPVEFDLQDVNQSVPAKFDKIVLKYRERVAVKAGNRIVTYGELKTMADGVARSILEQRGPGSEPVPVLFEKGIDQIATILAVLKAGKFFVLLDPSSPTERIIATVKELRAELLLSDEQNSELGRTIMGDDCQVVASKLINVPTHNEAFGRAIEPKSIANVRYTSGSTGQPKGVIQTHRNLLHQIMLYTNTYNICADDRIAVLTANTGNTITSTFLALLNGGTLLPFDVQKTGVNRLANWLQLEAITFTMISSPLFRSLCESLTGQERFPNLRLIRLASEAAHRSDVDLYKKHFPPTCSLANALSSGETNLLTTFYIDHETQITGEEVPLGYAFKDKQILLLNDAGREIGFNQVGEIVVRSKFLSPGYWNRPDLTEAKFKPDLDDPEKRLYFTGDFGLMLPDGCLIHKGRKDFRIKVRGHGVDLVEVENTLRLHPGVTEAVAVVRPNAFTGSQLIVYFTCIDGPALSVNGLRDFLKVRLPDYMIPSVFVHLTSLPLTPNGKVDRRSLPALDNCRPDLEADYVAPRTSMEEKLAEIWAEVLGVERIGIHDNFFDLGGNSLLAARLFIRIKKVFGKELSPASLFNAPTIDKFANFTRQDLKPDSGSLLVPIQPNGSKPPFFWACGYSSDIYLPRHLGQDQPLYGLLNQCHDGKRAVYSRLEDIAAHHLQEIRAVQPRGPYYLGGYCFGGMVAFELARQLKQQGEEIALLFLVDLATIKNCKALTEQIADLSDPLQDIESFQAEIFRHLGKLTALTPRKQLTYVSVRTMDRIRGVISVGRDLVKELICRVCLKSGHPIPPAFRLHYIAKVDRQVLRDYRPQAYTGQIVHIKAKASTSDPRLVAKLTAGRLDAYEIPCRHSDLIKDSHIHLWTNRLQSFLPKKAGKMVSKSDVCSLTRVTSDA